MSSKYQHQKGVIKDNALAALVHDPLFRQRVEKNKKGKGSYMRKAKHNKIRKVTGRPVITNIFNCYHWPFSFYFC